MKRLSALVAKFEEDISDSEAFGSTYDNNYTSNNHASDSESISEGSRKIRKKRDVYHKISDDIRVKLLESVQNGETLKSAAKRYKINYSSAKSILHTYRKEGRILKKSAQERTTKKKVAANTDNDNEPAPVTKTSKRENSKKVVAPLAERITTATTCASQNEENTSGLNENLVSILKMEHYGGAQQDDSKALARPPMVHVNYNTSEQEDHHRQQQKNPKLFDNFYMGYNDYHYPEVNGEYQGTEAADYTNTMYQSTEFDPFSDMMSALQPKGQKNEEVYHDTNSFFYPKGFNGGYGYEEKNGKMENGGSYEDNLENSGNPLKSFMDTQKLLQDAFRKANYMGGSGNQGFRKSSFDLF